MALFYDSGVTELLRSTTAVWYMHQTPHRRVGPRRDNASGSLALAMFRTCDERPLQRQTDLRPAVRPRYSFPADH